MLGVARGPGRRTGCRYTREVHRLAERRAAKPAIRMSLSSESGDGRGRLLSLLLIVGKMTPCG